MLSCAIPLYLCLISSKALSTTKTSFPGAIFTKENSRLKGYSFKWHVTPSQISCTQACLTNPRCYSTNFKETRVPGARQEGVCELNTEHPFDLILKFGKGFTLWIWKFVRSILKRQHGEFDTFLSFLILVPFYLFFLFELHFQGSLLFSKMILALEKGKVSVTQMI